MIHKPSELKFPKFSKPKEANINFKATFKKVLILSILSSTISYIPSILPEKTLLLYLSHILPWAFGILSISIIFNYFIYILKFKIENKKRHHEYIAKKLYNYLGEFNWISPPKKSNESIIAFKNYLVFVNLKKDTIIYISKEKIKEFNLKKENLRSINKKKRYTETIGINGKLEISENSKNRKYSSSKTIFNNYLEITTTYPKYEYLKFNFLENDNYIKENYSKMYNIVYNLI